MILLVVYLRAFDDCLAPHYILHIPIVGLVGLACTNMASNYLVGRQEEQRAQKPTAPCSQVARFGGNDGTAGCGTTSKSKTIYTQQIVVDAA